MSSDSKPVASIDILNDSDDDNDDEVISIKLKTQTIEINYFQLSQFSKLIRQEYNLSDTKANLSTKLQEFLDENNIPESVAVSFFKLIRKENIEISSDIFLNLCKLSSFFKSTQIKKFLVKFLNSSLDNFSFIISLIEENKSDESKCIVKIDDASINLEESLTKNINQCIPNNGFGQLPISIISHIIEASQFDEKTSDILYKFIEEKIEDRFSLFPFIDLENLSEENFDILYEKFMKENDSKNDEKKYYQCFRPCLKYMKKLKETSKDQEQKIKSLEEENEKIKSQLKDLSAKTRYTPNLSEFYCEALADLFDTALYHPISASTLFGEFDVLNHYLSIIPIHYNIQFYLF